MKLKAVGAAAVCLFALRLTAQTPTVPAPAVPPSDSKGQPLLESNETEVRLLRVRPHQSMSLQDFTNSLPAPEVIVALDAASISSGSGKESGGKALQAGDFVWIDGGVDHGHVYQNPGDKEARFLAIIFPRVP